MKRLSLIFLLLPAILLNAQTLKLKKKQQFQYETLRFSKYEPNEPSSNMSYATINFEVLKASKGLYVIKVTEPTTLSVSNGKLSDSHLPMQEQNKTFYAVAAKVLSATPYLVTIEKLYNVDEIHLVEALHSDNPAPEKLKVTTIACFDKIDLVKDFMTRKKYGYQVSNYPTKVLLLPNGVYVDIPSRSEYATLVTKYLAWEL